MSDESEVHIPTDKLLVLNFMVAILCCILYPEVYMLCIFYRGLYCLTNMM